MLMERLDVQSPSARVCDVNALRGTFGQFASGVTVVTCATSDGVHGMTANSFISVTLEPARALVSIKQSAKMHRHLEAADYFGLSVLGAGQAKVSNHFAGRRENEFAPEFEHVRGVPLISKAIAWMVCHRSQQVPVGDHTLFIGDLVDCDHDAGTAPLLFFGGRYAALTDAPTN